ncbi:MAG: hypothetical protein ABIP57_09065 [Jatrophihabitantaceae bacterium]
MTLVLRYVDSDRLICVGDTLITLSDNGHIFDFQDEYVSKSFFVCGYMVSYAGLAVLNHFGDAEVTTRDWIKNSLMEAQREDKGLGQTLQDMASVLSSNAVIAPKFKGSTLDIGMLGLSPAPENFDGDADAEFVFDENFSFEDDANRRWALVVLGHLTNINYTGSGQEFTGWAEHYRPDPGKTYHSWGADMPAQTVTRLDGQIVASASSIDIVNAFVTAIRETADAVEDGSVGRNITASVVPLQVLADAMGIGSMPYSERNDEFLLEGYVSYALVFWQKKQAVMVPHEQVNLIETDNQPSPGGFVG